MRAYDVATVFEVRAIRLAGELDREVVDRIGSELEEAWASRPSCLRIDLSDVSYIDSAGLGLLFRARQELPETSTLVLANANPMVHRLMTIVGLLAQPGVTLE